jgi:hypothetical protein
LANCFNYGQWLRHNGLQHHGVFPQPNLIFSTAQPFHKIYEISAIRLDGGLPAYGFLGQQCFGGSNVVGSSRKGGEWPHQRHVGKRGLELKLFWINRSDQLERKWERGIFCRRHLRFHARVYRHHEFRPYGGGHFQR